MHDPKKNANIAIAQIILRMGASYFAQYCFPIFLTEEA